MADQETKTITVRLPLELFERIEGHRGQVPREAWIRDACELRLTGRLHIRHNASARGNVRSSDEARADVKPIPKGAKK